MAIYKDANGNDIVYVRKKPTTEDPMYGPSSPCLVGALGYAIANGYEECAPPGETRSEVLTVAPEPTEADLADAAISSGSSDNSAAVVMPGEAEEDSAAERQSRKRSAK
jgi:hypothetical protein